MQFIRSIAVLLISACLMRGAVAQFNISGPGFLPDENGTNLDDPQAKKGTPKGATATVVKDCAECPEMVVIPAGNFVMGSERNIRGAKPLHTVTIRSFLISKVEITQKQWFGVMGTNPSRFGLCGADCPVDNVSWNDTQQFIAKLNQRTGQKYRLPSEAEWEYTARAGTRSEWSFGDDESTLGDYAWYNGNSGGKPQVVGQKLPNAFGLFDIHGNVREWVEDCWHENYNGAPADGSPWTTGCTIIFHILRGGSWKGNARFLSSALRYSDHPDNRSDGYGFRLARDL